jgi:hypothetical protein
LIAGGSLKAEKRDSQQAQWPHPKVFQFSLLLLSTPLKIPSREGQKA